MRALVYTYYPRQGGPFLPFETLDDIRKVIGHTDSEDNDGRGGLRMDSIREEVPKLFRFLGPLLRSQKNAIEQWKLS